MVEGIKQLKKEIIVNVDMPMESYDNAFRAIEHDYPEIFYWDIENTRGKIRSGSSYFTLSYIYPNDMIRSYQSRLDSVVNSILTPTVRRLPKPEIEKVIHDWLVRNVTYSPKFTDVECFSIIGPLFCHSGVCAGYSKAFQLLCERADINCLTISGRSTLPKDDTDTDMGHAWNMVQLSPTERYQLDVTWDSCMFHYNCPDDKYYNRTDEEMSAEHSWNRAFYPRTKKPSYVT